MARQVTISMEANPTLDLEYAPGMKEDFKKFLDLTGSGAAYAGQHSTSFLISFDDEGYFCIRQINPQAAQPANETTEGDANPGFVGSGGHNEQDDTK